MGWPPQPVRSQSVNISQTRDDQGTCQLGFDTRAGHARLHAVTNHLVPLTPASSTEISVFTYMP